MYSQLRAGESNKLYLGGTFEKPSLDHRTHTLFMHFWDAGYSAEGRSTLRHFN